MTRSNSFRRGATVLTLGLAMALFPLPSLASLSNWRQLPPLPDPRGFASPYTGVDQEVLLLAGGANFPEKQLWEGGRKVWHDSVMALRPGADQWTTVGRLPRSLAYGVSVSTADGVLCAGGGDAETHYATVFRLKFREGKLEFEALPPLPRAVAMAAGARVGDMVYVAGGLESPLAPESLNTFFALDLCHLERGWRTLPSWPGPARSQAVAAGHGDDFYLFSGLRYENNARGERELVYLKDAYRYRPDTGWNRLPDLPYAAAAAASPAPVAAGMVFVVSGVDGSGAGRSPLEFYPAPQRIQGFSIRTSTWSDAGHAPVGRVCVSTVEWAGRWVLPSGERSPGVRSPEVWSWQPQ